MMFHHPDRPASRATLPAASIGLRRERRPSRNSAVIKGTVMKVHANAKMTMNAPPPCVPAT
jgi:hypothetical protein